MPFSRSSKIKRIRLKRHRLLSMLMLTLVLSILVGTVTPIQSQMLLSSSQNDCTVPQTLCENVRQLAQSDVADDIPRRTSHAIDLFKEGHPDWETNPSKAKLEIGNTYDREYSRQEKVKKRSLDAAWEQWSESGLLVPFLGLFVLVVAAWFKDAIAKAWSKLIQAIDNWIYERFAGTPFFEGLALQRYREALVENYQHLKIPFRDNHEPLEMGEVYVPLKVAETNEGDQIDAYRAIAQYRRLMVKGIPGSGKTILLKHVAFSYGKRRLLWLEDRPIPVLIELHRLKDRDLSEEKLIAEIVNAFRRNRFPKAERFVRHGLEHGKLMLLLDGLDEVNSAVRPVLAQCVSDLLKSLDSQQRCRLIVTCRTAVYDHEFARETDQTLEVVDFSDQQMRRFLKAWQQAIPADKSIDQLMQTLRDRPRIMVLARNPLLLTLIAYLYTDAAFEVPRSRSEFYEVSTRTLLEQWQDQFNRYRGSDKRRVLQHLALHQQQASTQQQQDRRSIDGLVVLEQIRDFLPRLNLDPSRDTVPFLEELVERSGLFLKIDGGDRYQFPHLTLQEYFAAVALTDNPRKLIQFLQQDPIAWREVVKLWCGIAGNSTDLIMEVYQQDPVLGFECLADAQEVDQERAELVVDHCKGLLNSVDEQDELAKAFGAIAASARPRGRAVFEFLVETLDNSQQGHYRSFAANALSLTNSEAAALILASRYMEFLSQGRHLLKHSDIQQPFIRMGDLAVPYLHKHSLAGSLSALDDLKAIGTPDAAEAIVSSIWFHKSEEQQFWGRAAIHLATLLRQSEIEERLRNYPLSPEQSRLERLDWVWQPFSEEPNSALPIIAGRIAYLLSRIQRSPVPKPVPPLDPRLVVPLCGIHIFEEALPLSRWPTAQVAELLTEYTSTPQIEHQCLQVMISTFGNISESSSRWRILLAGLSPRMQLNLVQSIKTSLQKPSTDNWLSIFQSVQYEFKTSWHYRSVLLIAALLSLFAITGIWHTASAQLSEYVTGLLGFATVVIGIFWWTVAKGIEEPWEPSLFVRLGVLGAQTYKSELNQLFQNRQVWKGIETISILLRSERAVAVAAAVVFAGVGALTVAFAGAFAGAFAVAFAGAFAVAVAVAFTGAFAGAGAVAGAGAFAFAGAGAFAVAFAGAGAGAFTGAFAGAGAAYGIGILSGVGIGSWYYFTSEDDNSWLRFFAALAFPWFCTAPIVLIFAGIGLATLFTPHKFLAILPLAVAAFGELCLVGLSYWLWRQGHRREALAQNPFQGGLIEATLRTKYGRPRV
jgi:hypothetical protein